MLREWIAVAIGGMVGSLLRHATTQIFSIAGQNGLFLATLVVNIAGCFAIGWLAQWSEASQMANHWWTVGLRDGVLGGLTTFSSFGLDVVRVWQNSRLEVAIALIAVTSFSESLLLRLACTLPNPKPNLKLSSKVSKCSLKQNSLSTPRSPRSSFEKLSSAERSALESQLNAIDFEQLQNLVAGKRRYAELDGVIKSRGTAAGHSFAGSQASIRTSRSMGRR